MRPEVKRYGRRYWAVWCGEELLVVAVYKKGALAVVGKLQDRGKWRKRVGNPTNNRYKNGP